MIKFTPEEWRRMLIYRTPIKNIEYNKPSFINKLFGRFECDV